MEYESEGRAGIIHQTLSPHVGKNVFLLNIGLSIILVFYLLIAK